MFDSMLVMSCMLTALGALLFAHGAWGMGLWHFVAKFDEVSRTMLPLYCYIQLCFLVSGPESFPAPTPWTPA